MTLAEAIRLVAPRCDDHLYGRVPPPAHLAAKFLIAVAKTEYKS